MAAQNHRGQAHAGGLVVAKTERSGARESYVRAVDRVVDILECLAQSDRHWTLSLIAREVGLSPSTAHRLLGTLEQRQLVYRYPDSDVYTLGYRILSLTESVQQMPGIRQIALPELYRLRDATRATAALCLLSGFQRVTAAVVPSPEEVFFHLHSGTVAPLHTGCFSRAMLAFLPEEERSRYLDTLVDADLDSINADLEGIGGAGYAVTVFGVTPGVGGVAAPVFQRNGRVIASVGVLVPSEYLLRDPEPSLATETVKAARRISALTGYAPGPRASVAVSRGEPG